MSLNAAILLSDLITKFTSIFKFLIILRMLSEEHISAAFLPCKQLATVLHKKISLVRLD